MSDPYREQELSCPGCHAPLRAEAERLCCDACGGVLAPLVELKASLVDSTKLQLVIAFHHERPSELACPRCAAPMQRCRIGVHFEKVRGHLWRSVYRCATDGAWFPGGRFARYLALVESKAKDEYKASLPRGGGPLFVIR